MKKMMILLLSIFPVFGFAQTKLVDLYTSQRGDELRIKGDSLTLYTPWSHGYGDITWAECGFKWVDDNFIEINSTPPWSLVRRGMTIEEITTQNTLDSLRVSLSFPNYFRSTHSHVMPLEAEVSCSYGFMKSTLQGYKFISPNHHTDLVFPKGAKTISISVINPGYSPGTIDGINYGFNRCSILLEHEIEDGVAQFDIVVPAVDVPFFQKYYVKGEYAKVDKKTITWKGEVYTKVK